MKEHFSPKMLTFYISAIGLVVGIFSITTAYGEKNLKASRPIDGRYPLGTQTLPGCAQAKEFDLLVQQSGIYLTGSILPQDASEQSIRVAQERPLLSGQWSDPKLSLNGTFSDGATCQGNASLEGTIAADTLKGTLRLGSSPTAIDLTAKRAAPPPKTEKH